MSIPRLFSLALKVIVVLFVAANLSAQTTYTVSNTSDDISTVNSFRYIIKRINDMTDTGPYTINFAPGITAVDISYGAMTLVTSNVTINGRFVGCDPDVAITSPNDYYAFSITGSNVSVRGIKWRCRLEFSGGTGNSVTGCWFNVNDAGTAAEGKINNATLTLSNVTNMTVGGTATCNLRNVFSAGSTSPNQVPNAIVIAGTCPGLLIAGNYIGTDKGGTTKIANNTANGIYCDATTVIANAQIRNNTIVGNAANGIFLNGTADGLQILNNNIGATAAGNRGAADLGNRKAGIRLQAATNSTTISNNIVLDNGQAEDLADNSGIYIYGLDIAMSNVTVSNNRAGVDAANQVRGNDFSGIYIQRAGLGTLTAITVSGNIVGDNGNGFPLKKSHGIAFRDIGPAAAGNLLVTGNVVGVTAGNADIGNYGNGIEFFGVNGFTATANKIGFNKFATTVAGGWNGGGIMVNGLSTNGIIQGNFIGASTATGGTPFGNTNATNPQYPNQNAGICIEQSTNITIGGSVAGQENIIRNNNYGIQIINVNSSVSSGNTVIGNIVSNNTSHGVYILGGSNNNRVTLNQISCNGGQGIKLNYGANPGNNGQLPPIITSAVGTTVSGTATAGATIEVFNDDPSCNIACGAAVTDNRREGRTHIGTVTANGSGVWTLTVGSLDVNNVSATATVGQNTSEFSICSICPPVAAAGSDQTLCNVTTATLAGNTVTPTGTGTWTRVAGTTGTVTTPNSPTSGVTGLSVGTTTFRWTVTASGCTTTSDDVDIIVRPQVTATASASATSVCSNAATVTLTGNSPAPGTGLWTVSGGTATITNATSASTTATITSGTSVTFTWTITNLAPCPTSAANTTAITVTSPVTATANTSATSVCSNAATVTLTGSNPAPGTGLWTVSGGTATITNATSASTTATITSGTSVTFTWTITNGACITSANTPVITVTSPITATANASATAVCSNAATVTLTGSNPAPGTGLWTVSGGTATIANATSASTTATITSGTSVTFTWTITNGACITSANTTAITVTSPVTATANTSSTSVCSSAATVTLTGSNPAPGTGLWTVSGGTATITNATNASTTATITSGTSVTFTWTITNGACITSATTPAITVTSPITATASATSNVCTTSPNVTLTGNNPSPGTGQWTVFSGGTATFADANSPSTTATITSGTSVVFRWTITNGGCSSTANATTTVSSPVTATANSTSSVCSPAPVTLTGSNPAPGTGLWTVSGGTATITNATSANTTATITSGTSVTFTWTITNGACITSASSVSTTSSPVTASASATNAVCATTPVVSLTGNAPSPGTGLWTVQSGGTATFADATSQSTTATITSGTSVTFRWTVTNGACSAFADATSTVSAAVTANAGPPQSICNLTTATLAGSNPAPGTGAWTVTSGTGTVTSPTVANSGVTGLTVGASSTFLWTVTNGACQATSSVTISVSAPGTTSAGPAQFLCNTTTTTLAGSGTGTWTTVSGSGVVTNPTSPTSGVTGLTIGGVSTFEWTVTSGACSGSAQVVVTVDAPPVGDAGTDIAVCDATVATLNATGGPGTWTVTGGGTGTVDNPTSATSGVSNLTIGGSTTFVWTLTSANAACTSVTDVVVTSSSPVTAVVGPDQTLCNVTTATLSATGSGVWSTFTGSGVVDNPTSITSTVSNLTPGTSSVFLWTVTSGACSDDASVTITSSPTVTANGGSDQPLCNQTTATLAATGTGTWSTVSGTGVATNPASPTSGVTGLTVGATTVFKWKVSDGACADSVTVSISSSAEATANAGADQTLCNVTSTNLNASGAGTWTLTAGSGSITNPTSPTTGVTGLVIGSTSTFTWTVVNGACTATAEVDITPSAGITANAGADQPLCEVTTTTLGASGTGTWTKVSGPGTITTPTSPTSGVTGLVVSSTSVFQWKVVNGACADSATVTLTVSPGVSSNAGATQYLCNDNRPFLTALSPLTGTWTVFSGTGTIENPNDPGTFATFTDTSAVFLWTASGVTCGSMTDTVTVFNTTLATPDIAGGGSGVCVGVNSNFTVTNPEVGVNYTWSRSNSNITITPPNTGTSVQVAATGNGTLTVAAKRNNCTVTASKLIQTLPDLPSGRDTLRLATCLTTFVIEVDTLDNFFTGTWTSTNGTTISIQGDTLITLSNFVDGQTDTLTYTISGACGDREYMYLLKVGGQFDSLDMHGPSDILCVGKGRDLSIDLYPESQRNNPNVTYVWVSNLTYTVPPVNPVIGLDVRRDSTKVNTYTVNPSTANNVYVGYVVDNVTKCKTDTASVRVYAAEGQDLNVPNLITPNEDNQNDYWVLKDKVTGQDILPGSQFDLYNRWGQRIFGMPDYDNRFNAAHISDGIYYYYVKSGCGEKEYKGWLQILGNTNP